MPGIKSAIELAMERTKNLVMTEEERKSFTAKELENKIRAVVRRYLEGIIEEDGVNKEISAIEGDERSMKPVLVDLLVEAFDAKGRNERLLELLSAIAGEAKASLKQELETMQRRYVEQTEKGETTVRQRIMDRLREMGITGSAVEPNIEEWDEWGDYIEEAGRAFKNSITQWKDELKAVIYK
jgi:hypothetical protein